MSYLDSDPRVLKCAAPAFPFRPCRASPTTILALLRCWACLEWQHEQSPLGAYKGAQQTRQGHCIHAMDDKQ